MKSPTHPLHPMLVHFPIACWSLATLVDLISMVYRISHNSAEWLAGLLIVAGLVLAIPAMIAGLMDMIKIKPQSPALKIVNQHMTFVMVTWLLYSLSLYLRMNGTAISAPSLLAVAVSLLALVCLGITGWLGGKMVYELGVGVKSAV